MHFLIFINNKNVCVIGKQNKLTKCDWTYYIVRSFRARYLQKFIEAIHYVFSFLKTILKHFGPGGQKNILWNMSEFVFLESRSRETFRYSVLSFLKDLRAP